MTKLSVIIPVYKAENTIDRCIQSIIDQRYSDMQIWLIDDGSPDRSGEICDKWKRHSDNIHAIHKINEGVSKARNMALDSIDSEFVMFVDSDDYLESDTISSLMEIMECNEHCDILEFGVKYIGTSRKQLFFEDRTFCSARSYWHETQGWNHAYVCNKVFKLSVFDNMRFPQGPLEDLLLLPMVFCQDVTIQTTDKGCYYYCWNNNGTSADLSPVYIKKMLFAEQKAQQVMNTRLFSRNGWNLYYKMLCRQIDLYRISGEIILHWPGVRFICWLHSVIKGGRMPS